MSDKDSEKKVDEAMSQASVSDTLSFVFECGPKIKAIFAFGVVGGIGNGLVFPALAYLFSTSFSTIGAAASEGLAQVRELAFTFLVVGTFALAMGAIQTYSMEVCAHHATRNLRLKWFRALLRQDAAFFDVNDVGGTASQFSANTAKYQRGVGRKLGEGIQFFTTGVGGIGFALWSSWRVALVVLCVIPFVAVAGMATVNINTMKGTRAAKAYKKAGSIAYSTVSAIKTVFSLNAAPAMITQYEEATKNAFQEAAKTLIRHGAAFGSMLGSFLCLYGVLCLYGTSLLYKDVRATGCDPSEGVEDNFDCDSTGPGVFGAMLGVAFAGQGISQVGSFFESFTIARVAAHEALKAIRRLHGADSEIIYKEDDNDMGSTKHSQKSKDVEDTPAEEKVVRAILPKYEIDSSSSTGYKPDNIRGDISFKNVVFNYPTRPNQTILDGLSVDIKAGDSVAFVGPSGGGKSTVISMIERFYDPMSGTVEIDGKDIKNYNVTYLRKMIGYVGQEPTLFATSIRGNILYGKPDATKEEIEAAAEMANAHDFITALTDGYDTQVGDKGSQLSGGQKQRIAIARVLIANPRILLLDEATSALDAESELIVQEALDKILEQKSITTIIIAHRLSTIRGADVINVVRNGKVVESGRHDDLMNGDTYYSMLVRKQEGGGDDGQSSGSGSRVGSSSDLKKLGDAAAEDPTETPHVAFRDVVFAYPTRPKKIIFDDFNLSIKKGETIALVGQSGGGKSTTVGLVERFYDPTQGSVEYMGTDISTLNVKWYRDQIGYVGQEPTLFDGSIAENISYGAPGASRAQIEEAARQANAFDFITSFVDGFDTVIGEQGTSLSGGQKQRVAIARALVKSPTLLILDEATSALDNESEAIVQEAINNIMESSDKTVIVIAHRLSTIRSADRIAVIGEGKLLEIGSHDELMEKPHGRYKRLFDSSKRSATVSKSVSMGTEATATEGEEEIDWEKEIEEDENSAFDGAQARAMAAKDAWYLFIGAIGAIIAGGVFPMWGIMFAETLELLFRRVERCETDEDAVELGFTTCLEYRQFVADDMQDESFVLAGYWAILVVGCIAGNSITYWGFGQASERLSKRIRDSAFTALLRQEVAFFDKRSVGSITSQLQDDAANIQAFSGEPIRSLFVALSSVLTGLILSFAFMWQFALLALGCVPIMGWATSIQMSQFLGEDIGDVDAADGLKSPGTVVVETLLNMRTVSALTLEETRVQDYERALIHSESNHRMQALLAGVSSGMSQFIQQWVNGLQLWFGGYLLFNFDYTFRDFLIGMFAMLFSLFGLGAAFQDVSNKQEVEKSAGRIQYLLNRKSSIDCLSDSGKKLD